MKKNIIITSVIIVAIVLLVVINNTGKNNNSVPSNTTTPAGTSAETSVDFSTPDVKEFTMTAKQWEFSPSTITVNKGDKVRLLVTSIDVAHGINLPDFGVSGFINPGKQTVVEFVADKQGTFSFFCNVACGIGHSNMRGTLIVN